MTTPNSPPEPPKNLAGLGADPVTRNYQFVGLAALLVVFAVLAQRGDLVVALLPLLNAFLGLFFASAVPAFVFLFVTAYLLVCPFGLPFGLSPVSDIPGSHFRVSDLVVVGAVAVYLACQFRVLSLTARAVPADDPFAKKKSPPTRRPPQSASASEVERLFLTAAVAVVLGQILWLAATTLRVDAAHFPPVRVAPERSPFGPRAEKASDLPAPLNRAVVLGGIAVLGGFAGRFVFWYWRVATLTPAEGEAVLLDTGWRENRRELSRREVWRAWATARVFAPPAAPRPPRTLVGWAQFAAWVTAATLWVMALVFWYTSNLGTCVLLAMLGFGGVLWMFRRVVTNDPPAPPAAADPDDPPRSPAVVLLQVASVGVWVVVVVAMMSDASRPTATLWAIAGMVGIIAMWYAFRTKPKEADGP